MPVVAHFIDDVWRREHLHQMTSAAIEPILGLHQATHNHFTDFRSQMGGGGCAGGGCGGGI
jgi:hypothetical protein